MENDISLIDQALSVLDGLADAKGVLRCANVFMLYKILTELKNRIINHTEENVSDKEQTDGIRE